MPRVPRQPFQQVQERPMPVAGTNLQVPSVLTGGGAWGTAVKSLGNLSKGFMDAKIKAEKMERKTNLLRAQNEFKGTSLKGLRQFENGQLTFSDKDGKQKPVTDFEGYNEWLIKTGQDMVARHGFNDLEKEQFLSGITPTSIRYEDMAMKSDLRNKKRNLIAEDIISLKMASKDTILTPEQFVSFMKKGLNGLEKQGFDKEKIFDMREKLGKDFALNNVSNFLTNEDAKGARKFLDDNSKKLGLSDNNKRNLYKSISSYEKEKKSWSAGSQRAFANNASDSLSRLMYLNDPNRQNKIRPILERFLLHTARTFDKELEGTSLTKLEDDTKYITDTLYDVGKEGGGWFEQNNLSLDSIAGNKKFTNDMRYLESVPVFVLADTIRELKKTEKYSGKNKNKSIWVADIETQILNSSYQWKQRVLNTNVDRFKPENAVEFRMLQINLKDSYDKNLRSLWYNSERE